MSSANIKNYMVQLSRQILPLNCVLASRARAQFKGRVCLDNCTMQFLMFADNTALLAETEKDLQHNVREFSKAVKQHRLAMNTEKETTMVFSSKQVDCSVTVDDRKVENVRKQTYLGVRYRPEWLGRLILIDSLR